MLLPAGMQADFDLDLSGAIQNELGPAAVETPYTSEKGRSTSAPAPAGPGSA